MMDSFKIEEAFCETRNCLMYIHEAWLDYERNQQELVFRCPDANCRAALNSLLSAVNYKARVFRVRPHFRRVPEHTHIENCKLGQLEVFHQEMWGERKQYQDVGGNWLRNGKSAGIAFSDIPDEFLLDGENENPIQDRRGTICRPDIMSIPRTYEEKRGYAQKRRNKTFSFDELVDVFQRLQKSDLPIFKLKIGQYDQTYRDVFKWVKYIEERHAYGKKQLVYYGGARILAHQNNGFSICFIVNAAQYGLNKQNIPVIIPVPASAQVYVPELYETLGEYAKAPHRNYTAFILGSEAHRFREQQNAEKWLSGCRTGAVVFETDTVISRLRYVAVRSAEK